MSIEDKKGKEESREKLIQELQDLGQLIAPNDSPSSETESPSESALLLTPLSDAFDEENTQTTEVDVPEGPATVDMFVADDPPESTLPASHGEAPNAAPPSHESEQGLDQDQATTPSPPAATFESAAIETALDTPPDNPGSGGSGAYLDELVDELVGAVEKRLSLQSGESLPESLRDELSRDIKDRLAPWWSEG
mgnify:CR=1 FL=1